MSIFFYNSEWRINQLEDVYGKREDNQKTKLTILLKNISQEDKTLSSFQIHLPQQVVV